MSPIDGKEVEICKRKEYDKIDILLKGLLKNNREVAIPSVKLTGPLTEGGNTDKDDLIVIKSVEGENFLAIKHPDMEELSLTKEEASKLVIENGGRYWSYGGNGWSFEWN